MQKQQGRSPQPAQQDRLMVGGIVSLGLVAVVALAVLGGQSSFEPTPPPDQAARHEAPVVGGPEVSVVRIDAGGNAVITGRAMPGATVTLKSNDKSIGSTESNARGDFTFVTSRPLDPGDQNITLSSRLGDGAERAPAHGIAVNVPAMPNEGPLAVLTGKNLAASRFFGGDRREQAPASGPLAISSVDYSGTGSAVIAGTAPRHSQVELLIGDVALGHTLTGANGRWTMHIRSVPRLSGQFHLKAFQPHSAASANAGHGLPNPGRPSRAQPLLET